MVEFRISSPTITNWNRIILTARALLLNPAPQMNVLLESVRDDIDSQFDENQSFWKPLRPYTVEKKAAADSDPRILHETREGSGLRLRDAYAKAGSVDNAGRLSYSYPIEKPYAIEHQEGKTDATVDKKTTSPTKPKKKRKSRLDKAVEDLDKEFFDRFR